ncbi:MAG: glycosyltransferase family 39 protein [Candidatus Woesebacteria bacterium]|nr:glycosyltransferase family 39 protein [Candidatus Woesebacteria bacterium]
MSERTKNKTTNFFIPNIVYVLIIGLIVRIFLSVFGTLHLDQGTFIAWSVNLAQNGFKNFYNSWSDYLPGYLYFLWGLGKINLLGLIPEQLLFKLPAIISDLFTGLLIYKIIAKPKGEKWGIVGAAIYLFNPAVFANSALWGQVDSLTALTSTLSIYLMPFSFILSAASLAAGTLVKPQTAFIFPVIFFMMLKEKWKIQKIFAYLSAGLVIFVGGFIPFWNHATLASFVFERIGMSLNQYPYTSVNAFNFWGLTGFWKADNVYYQIAGYALVSLLTIFAYIKLWKNKNAPYYLSTLIFAASFIFFTRMHERHMLPVFAPLAIIAVENPIFLIPYFGFSLTYVANLYYAYVWITGNFRQVFSDFALKFLEILNVGFVVFIFYSIARSLKAEWEKILLIIKRLVENWEKRKTHAVQVKLPRISISPQRARLFLILILMFAFVTRTFDLWSPKAEYFDEVYHAFTARVILHGDPKAWEWWNTPPAGFAYEWTHPPLAKLGMVAGMLVFGENSFGWRIPGAILGVGSVLLIYLLAKGLFKDEAIGLASAGVFSLDGLALVMSRIGMNDPYILFFALLSIYLFFKQKDFFSAISFGLALASKWSALWAIPILFVLWLRRKDKFRLQTLLCFLILPFAFYFLTYLPMFLTGHNLSIWWGMQEQMWWYHTGLRATHPYTSSWWSWPLLIRPIYLYTSDEVRGMVARIYAMGNPLVFWFGLTSVILCFVYSYLEKDKNLAFVVFAYLIFFVPWAVSPRIMFLYHYLPSIPFLAIATGYILRRTPKLIFGYLLICLLVFIYFYPHWAGLSIPLWLDRSYYWVSSWR